MNKRALYATLLLATLSLPCDAMRAADADSVLRKAGSFALGGIGAAGTMSEGERALRDVLKQSDVSIRLEKLASEASPAGQLYALLGLRIRDRTGYERTREKLRKTDGKVQTVRGCMLQQESFGDLLKQIEHGDYDAFLSREWPEHAR